MQPSAGEVSMKTDAEYQAEYDLNTLIDAEKIKKDSKRLKAVMARKKHLEYALMKDYPKKGKKMMGAYPKKSKEMSGSMHSY